MKNNERMITANSVEICTESFGDSSGRPLVLIMGAMASMVWWDDEFCNRLAGKGFYVVRYDNRDTGKSTCYPPGESTPYDVVDMTQDLFAVMEAYDMEAANLVGMSLGGMIAQIAGIMHPERVSSIAMIASAAWAEVPDMPPMDPALLEYHASAGALDWNDKDAVISYLADGWKLLNGSRHAFDPVQARKLAETEVTRARHLMSMFNHAMLGGGEEFYGRISELAIPVLIIHGTEDPVLPYPHAEAAHRLIPGSELHTLIGAGHELHPDDWNEIIEAVDGNTRGIFGNQSKPF